MTAISGTISGALSGLGMRIRLGRLAVLRCPRLTIDSTRHQPLTLASLVLPDPAGEVGRTLTRGDAAEIQLGYRDQTPATWRGTVGGVMAGPSKDQVLVRVLGPELLLVETLISQTWLDESPEAIVRAAVRQAGLPLRRIDSPGMMLRHFVASGVAPWQLARQAAHTVQRATGQDMRRWALWMDASGAVNWGDFEEPGDEAGSVPAIATRAGLIRHEPASGPAALSRVETFLLPSMRHSRLFRLRDERRSIDEQIRALRVVHEITPGSARTHLFYGDEHE